MLAIEMYIEEDIIVEERNRNMKGIEGLNGDLFQQA